MLVKRQKKMIRCSLSIGAHMMDIYRRRLNASELSKNHTTRSELYADSISGVVESEKSIQEINILSLVEKPL